MSRPKRKYEDLWNIIKESDSVKVQLTSSTVQSVIDQHYKTVKKAVTKEKYIDDNFKRKYPFAVLNSSLEGNVIKFTLELNNFTNIKVEDIQ